MGELRAGGVRRCSMGSDRPPPPSSFLSRGAIESDDMSLGDWCRNSFASASCASASSSCPSSASALPSTCRANGDWGSISVATSASPYAFRICCLQSGWPLHCALTIWVPARFPHSLASAPWQRMASVYDCRAPARRTLPCQWHPTQQRLAPSAHWLCPPGKRRADTRRCPQLPSKSLSAIIWSPRAACSAAPANMSGLLADVTGSTGLGASSMGDTGAGLRPWSEGGAPMLTVDIGVALGVGPVEVPASLRDIAVSSRKGDPSSLVYRSHSAAVMLCAASITSASVVPSGSPDTGSRSCAIAS
mmetsp:Transcript_32504/g.84223  ORF Transcript_32504/g.84223 Transcript_32504/m.84223 type:complete len:304 (+) Transcript_32504:248-1159(+)